MRLRLVLVLAMTAACLLAALSPAGAVELIFNTQEFAPFTYSEGGVVKGPVKDLTIDMTPQDEAAFQKLSVGRVQAVFSNRDVGYGLSRSFGITNIRYTGRQQSLKYYVGFSQKFTDKALVDQFSAAFRTLHKQGVIQEILTRNRMDPAPLE